MILGAGGSLQLFTGGSFTPVVNVTSIGGPAIEVDDVNVTVLANSTDMYKRFLAAWADAGVIEAEGFFDPTQYGTLLTNVRTANQWQIVFSNGSKIGFSGYIKGLKADNPLEETVTTPFTIKVSGPPTFTA